MRRAAILLVFLVAAALAGPLVAPDPTAQDLSRSLERSSAAHPLGTDIAGRDLLARVLMGTRISLLVGVAATCISLVVGLLVGLIAGWSGGAIDSLLMRAVDVLQGLPYMVFVAVLAVVIGRGLVNIFVAIGAVSWLTTARVVRQEVRRLRGREFVEAARALGAGPARILLRHVAPNLFGPVIVVAALGVPQAVRQEALLSFVGLGVEPPAASLGTLLRDGLAAITPLSIEWGPLLAPAVVLVLIVLAMNGLADGLRDRLDPRGRA